MRFIFTCLKVAIRPRRPEVLPADSAHSLALNCPPVNRFYCWLATDWQQLPASLDHLRAARPQWLYTGHSARRLAAADIWARAAG
jgi:hypothetical protein